MLPSFNKDATIRWSDFTLSSLTPQPSSDVSTPTSPISKSPQSNQLGVDVASTSLDSGDARRKKPSALPPISEEAYMSTGGRASLHRRTPSVTGIETIRGKPSKGLPKSTEPHTNRSKASSSRKKVKGKRKVSSGRTTVQGKQLVKDELYDHVGSVASDSPDVTLCNIDDVGDVLYATPATVPSNALPEESLRKSVDERWTTASTFPLGINASPRSDHRKSSGTNAKEELMPSWTVTKTKMPPLQDLSLNGELSLLLSSQRSPSLTPPGVTRSNVTAGGTTTNQFGCVLLGASELAMEISFYQKPHFEVWDMPDR
jgi:hypothetical protein